MHKCIEKALEIYNKAEKHQKDLSDMLNCNKDMKPKSEAIKIALIYGIIGALWVLLSDEILHKIVLGNQDLFKEISLYKGWFFIIITTILIYLLIEYRIRLLKKAKDKIFEGYEELSTTHEELIATQEELQEQYLELEKHRDALLISEQRYELAVAGSNDGIWDWDNENDIYISSMIDKGKFGDENYKFKRKLESWMELIHPDDKEKTIKIFNDYLSSGKGIYENIYRMRTQSNEDIWILSRGKAIWDKNGKVIRMAGSHTDITKWKEVEKELYNYAYYDILTQLPNRVFFEMTANKLLSENVKNHKIALIYFDIDDFKHINDSLGHLSGDELLIYIGHILKKHIKKPNFVARLSGDEFAILLVEFDNEKNILEYVEKLYSSLRRPWIIGEHEFFITVSMGIAICPYHGKDILMLLKNADTALFHAKENGKNKYSVYNKEMEQKTLKYISLVNDLRHAIYNKEFQLYYQPKFNLITRKLQQVEALIRWKHNTKGFISPADFIPIAEETGLINDIEQWVLETACTQMRQWIHKGFDDISISVNLSGKRLLEKDLVEKIFNTLKEKDLSANYIHIEITETSVIENYDIATKTLNQLKDMGIKIEMDDFGKGYSSLNYLKELPINVLKIDRDFIKNLSYGSSEEVIVKSIVDLAHSLNLEVIAEGIETKEQLHILLENNCDMGQGYYYCKPVPAQEIESMLK